MDLEQQLAAGRPEARSVAFTDMEVSADGRTFEGFAATYNQDADLGEWVEMIAAPAFRGAIERSGNIPMLMDHNAGLPPFATTGAGTLELRDVNKGLHVKATLDERHLLGPTLISMLERGEIRGMSFGFVAGQGNSKVSRRNGKPYRVIKGFSKLLDVSPTWNPAYEGTSAELRSLRQLATIIDTPEQAPQAEVTEHGEDGPAIEDHDVVVPEQPEAAPEQDEQRSGVDAVQTAAAARRRRLQMMGLSLPKDDDTPRPTSTVIEERSVAPPPTRDMDEILRYPRETWSPQEKRSVADRQKQVQTELFALVSEAERVGRNLTAEEADTFASLQSEFERLRR
jgi:HK97 family phage prohead protease